MSISASGDRSTRWVAASSGEPGGAQTGEGHGVVRSAASFRALAVTLPDCLKSSKGHDSKRDRRDNREHRSHAPALPGSLSANEATVPGLPDRVPPGARLAYLQIAEGGIPEEAELVFRTQKRRKLPADPVVC